MAPFESSLTPESDLESYQAQLERHVEHSSFLDSAGATFDLGVAGNPTTAVVNYFRRKSLGEGQPLVPPKELNERYPNLEVPFSEPMPMRVAADIAAMHDFKQGLARQVQTGPQGAPYSAMRFGVGLTAGMLDPLMAITTMGAGAALRGAGVTGRIAAGVEGIAGKTAANFAVGATDAAIGMAAPEAISGAGALQNQEDFGLKNYAENLATLAAFGGAIHAAPSAVRFLKRIAGGKPDQVAQAAAISQSLLDRNVETTPIVKQALSEMDGGVIPPPEFRSAFPTPGENTFYHAREGTGGSFREGMAPLEHDLGPGIYLTDSPQVANGAAARAMADAPGRVTQVNVSDLNLKALPLEEVSRIEAMSPEKQMAYDATLKAEGFDGYRYEGGKYLGGENAPHNVVKVFTQGVTSEPLKAGESRTYRAKNGEEFTVRFDGGGELEAVDRNGKAIGALGAETDRKGRWIPADVRVNDEWQGKGVGAALYQELSHLSGGNMVPSGNTSAQAWTLWLRNYPEQAKIRIEELAQGWVDAVKSGQYTRAEVLADLPRNSTSGGTHRVDTLIREAFEAKLDGKEWNPDLGKNAPPVPHVIDTGAKLQAGPEFIPSSEVTREPTVADAQKIAEHQTSIESHRLYDADAHQAMRDLIEHPLPEEKLPERQAIEEQLHEELKQMIEDGHFSHEVKRELEAVMEEKALDTQKESAFKQYMQCLIGNLYG